ncbi:MAG: protein kinase, partial [Solirubrobacterales bacterium]|nr:protein kinase [Solirubrobacterales bacterium]
MARDERPPRFHVGATLGPWQLLERLGGTRNSEVWEASRGDEALAVKFLRGRGATRYQRFKDEVRFLREMAPPEGVLPWRDSHLPERITPANPAWLAMPVARRITDALVNAEQPAREAVAAVRDIAFTLAGLAGRGIAHRDLKPGNLFRLDGDWVVGDFGLVDYPDKPELTVPNQKLGPAHFVADEMIDHPDTADPHPADVFSLAKTLWVLCVPGQDYPPSGQQRIEVAPATIGHWVGLPYVEQLDLLIERATALDPASRPTMAHFAAELTAWLNPPRERRAADLSVAAARIGALSEAGLRVKQLRDRRRELFTAAVAQIEQHLAGLVEKLATVFPDANHHQNPPLMSDFGHDTEPERIEQQVTRGAFGTNADSDAVTLMLGIGAQWIAEDDARYCAWIHVEDRYAGSRLLWSKAADSALGSAQQNKMLASLRDELAERLPETVEFVAGRLELRTDRERYANWSGEESGLRFSYPSATFAPFAYNDAGCYVVDTGNHRIRRFGPGGIELEWQAQGGRGTAESQLDHPMGGCFTHER